MTYSNHINDIPKADSCENYANIASSAGYDAHSNHGNHPNYGSRPSYKECHQHYNYANAVSGLPNRCNHGCNAHSNYGYPTTYSYYHADNGKCNDHYNETSLLNYNDHVNYLYCSQTYYDHSNKAIDYPRAYQLGIVESKVDSWTYIPSAVEDIKKLRDEIQALSVTKFNTLQRRKIDFDTSIVHNVDAAFLPGQPTKVEQINETIANVENLWLAIKGASSGLSLKPHGHKKLKQDYKDIVNRAQALASTDQPPEAGYLNHSNAGAGAPGYNNHSNCANVSVGEPGYVNANPAYVAPGYNPSGGACTNINICPKKG